MANLGFDPYLEKKKLLKRKRFCDNKEILNVE